MDLAMLCRSCMNEVASWELQNFDTRIVEMFYFCTNIKITDEDKLPKQFCYNCTIKIESVYTFIVEAQKVNVTLKNIVSRDTSVIVQLDSQTNNIEPNVNNLKEHIKLTLPDYKISASIATYDEQVIFEDTDEQNMEKDSNEEHTKENGINTSSPIQELESNQQVIKDKEEVKDIKLGELKKNICAVCRKGFTSKAWFNKHMQKEHTGHKYACAHCPKTFSKPGQLSYHAASHSEERRFACTMCDKRFKRRKQLAAHARSHTDVRPFACDQCSMSRQPVGARARAHRRASVRVRRVFVPRARVVQPASPPASPRRAARTHLHTLPQSLLRRQWTGSPHAHTLGRAAVRVPGLCAALHGQLEAQDAPHARSHARTPRHTAHETRRTTHHMNLYEESE